MYATVLKDKMVRLQFVLAVIYCTVQGRQFPWSDGRVHSHSSPLLPLLLSPPFLFSIPSSRHCLARHFRTWLTTYIWSRKGLDAGSARLPTDRVLFHAHTTHSVTVLLLPGHMSGTASQQTYVMRTLPTRVSGANLKRTGFLAAGAQCDILLIALYK